MSDILETMYGGSLPIASKKKKLKKKATSEAAEDEKAYEPQPKKVNKDKKVIQVNEVGSDLPNIQEEVEDLEPVKVLDQRTRAKQYVGSSGSIPAQSRIKKKKSTPVRKLKESQYILKEEEDVEATELVTREIRNKKALQLAKEIEVPSSRIIGEDAGENAQKVIKVAGEVQKMVSAEAGELLKITAEDQIE